MKKRVLSLLLTVAMAAGTMGGVMPLSASAATANAPQYQANARQMEDLSRGLIAVKTTADASNGVVGGVYLSWRLLGTESLENQAFDIYKNDKKIYTTKATEATNYIDTAGKATDKYKVVKAGTIALDVKAEPAVTPIANNYTARGSLVGNGSEKNSFTYVDVPIQMPPSVPRTGDGKLSSYVRGNTEGGANDASVGDLDGDGDYEIVLKWNPQDAKDSAGSDYTGNVYIDAYEITTDSNNLMWRIDLGKNVTAGAHYTQYIVYDFDGDGDSEIAMKTAPGSIDGTGKFVTAVGDTEKICNADNTAIYTDHNPKDKEPQKGKNTAGPQYLTIFDGETGEALATTDFIPTGDPTGKEWGDTKANRSERYLAGVAYIDGIHPSIIMSRGYYNKAIIRAYSWDGATLDMVREWDGSKSGNTSLYGQGCHSLSVADIDNDGKDEIIFGSAVADDDGSVYEHHEYGHGDALHVSDFDNDGVQEMFQAHEAGKGSDKVIPYAVDIRRYNKSTNKIDEIMEQAAVGDIGRGVMANVDDEYAKEHPDARSLFWSSASGAAFDIKGNQVNATHPKTNSRSMTNFFAYWDGDLSREILDDNQLTKYDAATGYTTRFYNGKDGWLPASSNNGTKQNPSLVADIWGDWREEIIMPVSNSAGEDTHLRIFTSTIKTDYRLTTLMHDCQYREAIAWQNVGYNQPPHPSYYIGSAALATDASGKTLNYLAPATPYTKVVTEAPDHVAVTGITLSESDMRVEKGKSATIIANIEPADATRKGVTWTTSNADVATVSNGVVRGVSAGRAVITATTKDGGFTAKCNIEVFQTPVTGVTLSDSVIELGAGYSARLKALIEPADATDQSVVWKSSNPAVASVSANGIVTGHTYGKTTITATTTDGGYKAVCTVRVGSTETVDATGADSFAFAQPPADTEKTTLSASADGASIAQVSASEGTLVQKSFESYSDGRATLQFTLTTGGQQNDEGKWDWTGREYSMGLKLLDTNGNNIMEIVQPYAASPDGSKTGAGSMTYRVMNDPEAMFLQNWTEEQAGSGTVQGSAKSWLVTAEFDYGMDNCKITVRGLASDPAKEGVYSMSFGLDGASFKTLQLYTRRDNQNGVIKANPSIAQLSYSKMQVTSGTSAVLYDKGSSNSPWAASDIDGWTQTSKPTAALSLTDGCILYNPTKPGAPEYNAKKMFDIAEDATVTYDIDWYFGYTTGRPANFEYIQFGDALRIGWSTNAKGGYYTWVSTDQGATWRDHDGNGTTDEQDSIFDGKNELYTKNINIVFDTKTNTIKSFSFDGKVIDAYTNFALPENTLCNYVQFGLQRGGGTNDSPYPNGIKRIYVSQFKAGGDTSDKPDVKVSHIDKTDKAVYVSYTATGHSDAVTLIGALYDTKGALVEVVSKEIASPIQSEYADDVLTFEHAISGDVKVFMWDSVPNMVPLAPVAQ